MAGALRDDAIIGRDASLTDAARVSQPGFSGSRTKPVMATLGHRQLSRREQASQDMSIELMFGSDGAKIKKKIKHGSHGQDEASSVAVTSRKRNVTATSLYQSLVSRPISAILSPSSLISPVSHTRSPFLQSGLQSAAAVGPDLATQF